MELTNMQPFNWNISNQVDFSIPTCEPWRLNAERTPFPDFAPLYLLTIFPIDSGKGPKTILIEPGSSEGRASDRVVDEPIGSKLVLGLKDTTGAEGGILPHVFEVVAGRSTECIQPSPVSSHPEFAFQSDASDERPDNSRSLHIDVQGGVPPYETTLIQLNASGLHLIPPASPHLSPLIHSINIFKNNSLLIAVSDSTGKWAQGPPVLDFRSRGVSGSQQAAPDFSPNSVNPQRPTGPQAQVKLPTTNSQQILRKRASNPDNSSIIIVVDVIALALLIIVTVTIILCDVRRRRRRRQLSQLKAATRLHNVDGSSAPDLEAARATNENEGATVIESSQKNSNLVSVDVRKSLPLPPPPTPVTISPDSINSTLSSLQSRNMPDRSTLLGAPTSYGDPYANDVQDVQSTLSRKTSSSSYKKMIAKIHSRYFDVGTLNSFDARSGTLSRNISKSSASTERTEQHMPTVPPSAFRSQYNWRPLDATSTDTLNLPANEQGLESALTARSFLEG